jgi:PAS domain S-box-containing protein
VNTFAAENLLAEANVLYPSPAMQLDDSIFRIMVENAFDIATILGADGTIKYESPAVKKVLGWTPEELVGQNAFDFIHAEDQERVRQHLSHVVIGFSDGNGIVFRFRNKDGLWTYLEATGTNMMHDPRISGIIVSSRDVTGRMVNQAAFVRPAAQR